MKIKPIKTEQDYTAALERLEDIFDAKPNTVESDELEILGILIEKYEDEHFLKSCTNRVVKKERE